MNKQALAEALARADGLYPRPDQFLLIEDAARLVERLLPGEDGNWDDGVLDAVENVLRAWAPDLNDHAVEQFTKELLTALAEAQPFPPAGGVS